MCVKHCFLVIAMVHAASSCLDSKNHEYTIKMSIKNNIILNQEIIVYCKNDTFTLRCIYDTDSNKPYALYYYMIYKCSDINCDNVVPIKNFQSNSHNVSFTTDKLNDNSIYGCGMIESPPNDPITFKGTKAYRLKSHKSTTTTETSMTPFNGSWIWKIALGVLLLVFCAFLGWLINDRLKKNKRRNVTRDTSAMNYENLAEDRYCPESSKANQGRVKEATTYAVPKDCLDNDDDPNYAPISNFNNETYAVPYQGDLYAKPVPKCERNKNEMYAQVIPKNKHAAEEMYAEVLPNNKLISKTLDMRGQKYGNTNNGSGTMPIPKPRTLKNNKVQDLYTNVSEIGEEKRNSIYNSSDKEYYSNVNMKDKQYSNTPNQQYVNAERSEYAEPAYCEIPKYVNKK